MSDETQEQKIMRLSRELGEAKVEIARLNHIIYTDTRRLAILQAANRQLHDEIARIGKLVP